MIKLVHIKPIDFQVGDIIIYHSNIVDWDLLYEKNIFLSYNPCRMILSKTIRKCSYNTTFEDQINCLWTYISGVQKYIIIAESFSIYEDFLRINDV